MRFHHILRQSILLVFFGILLFATPAYAAGNSAQLLTRPWRLTANRGPKEAYQLTDPNILKGYDALRVTYNLNGFCLLGGDASALIFDQPVNRTWRYVSLSRYGRNCSRDTQTLDIPLTDFRGLDISKQVGTFHVRIWGNKSYRVDIAKAELIRTHTPVTGSTSFGDLLPTPRPSVPLPTLIPATPTIRPTATPLPTLTLRPTVTRAPTAQPETPVRVPTVPPIPTQPAVPTVPPSPTSPAIPTRPPILSKASWSIQSVSSMKETKDRICSPRDGQFLAGWVDKAAALGVNYIAVETPYDNPACGSSLAYTAAWVQAIRARNIAVWHRHMPLAFEGIYNTPKNPNGDYLQMIANYIHANPGLFAEGDIFTPIPEPQNGGISRVTYCAQGSCVFRSAAHFNTWLRDAIDVSERAFTDIGLGGKIKIGYYGFDGFVAWGHNNPDWDGILEDATILKMGNITIDHYPEIVGTTMEQDLKELEARYPNIPIVIGEWGTITGNDTEASVRRSMQAAKRPSVVGFNYWHMGIGGKEELIHDDFTENIQYDDVRSFFMGGTP